MTLRQSVRALGAVPASGSGSSTRTCLRLMLGSSGLLIPHFSPSKSASSARGPISSWVSSVAGSSLSFPRILKLSFLKQPQRKGERRWGWGWDQTPYFSTKVAIAVSETDPVGVRVGSSLRSPGPRAANFRPDGDGRYCREGSVDPRTKTG